MGRDRPQIGEMTPVIKQVGMTLLGQVVHCAVREDRNACMVSDSWSIYEPTDAEGQGDALEQGSLPAVWNG
jgi:hypothetical protein